MVKREQSHVLVETVKAVDLETVTAGVAVIAGQGSVPVLRDGRVITVNWQQTLAQTDYVMDMEIAMMIKLHALA